MINKGDKFKLGALTFEVYKFSRDEKQAALIYTDSSGITHVRWVSLLKLLTLLKKGA